MFITHFRLTKFLFVTFYVSFFCIPIYQKKQTKYLNTYLFLKSLTYLETVALDKCLCNILTSHVRIFYFLCSDVFPLRQFENVLFSVDNLQCSILQNKIVFRASLIIHHIRNSHSHKIQPPQKAKRQRGKMAFYYTSKQIY